MAVLVTDPWVEKKLKAKRADSGADRFDEVWNGVYFMTPLANDEHQDLAIRFGYVCLEIIGWPGLGEVRTGVNVSDRVKGWKKNYRIPDVAVFLKGGKARNCGTHWYGGPDFATEIISPNDRSRKKIPFYSKIGVQELLLVDREPWSLVLYRRRGQRLVKMGLNDLERTKPLHSQVLALTFRLLPGEERPGIEVVHTSSDRKWII